MNMGLPARRSGLQHVTAAACLLCVLLQVASGLSITKRNTDLPHSARLKRDVYPSYKALCKANARNCDPKSLVHRRSQDQRDLPRVGLLQAGGGQQLSQEDSRNEDVLYRVLQKSLSIMGDIKPSETIVCKSNPRTCVAATESVANKKRKDPQWLWNKLLQSARTEYGFNGARTLGELGQMGQMGQMGELGSEGQHQQDLSPSDVMDKLQASLSGWQRLSELQDAESPAGLDKEVRQDEFYQPW